ncbi:RHS repeat-associated core domain-containing protein [Myroides marinus]|uniref:RHS repeat-associated core domain-containing protein n=1 Tax=Myroides marinus TaxID=703342 RepID=A0A161S9Q1_9FLAO|nr:RHS repeat-associated core domain-containing protein [Myroides marinus]KZE82274.1 hypothetical protein AV926_07195 [Myroides marinus]MDM1352009.1 RHS repeat-associated core domain-containing protein [Myroides marinus]MDM1359224.1 RHS repeat-associated core domain-containing protein [Myroides marinus]MDM1366477.1 RHS repeat-associated core domain-containing protein [Myroides marinus]
MRYVKGKLSFLPTAEGFFNAETNAYVYQYKDHLGNVRLSYSDKSGDNTIQSSNEIIEETNYYPFGLAHKGYNQKNDALMKDYKYQYNGKEKQEELGLNFYDYGARNYDAAIGRWMNVDPLAEKYMRFTPYVYVANNPIMFIDPDGRKIVPTGMTPTQRKAYDSRINDVRGTNKMFNTIYSSLESSSKTHTIGFGSTISVNGNTVPGQVSPTSTGSSVVFENEGSFNNNPVLFEEFFHAYQIDNGLDNSGLNLEFEAKVGTTFMNEGTINDDGMDFDFEFEIFDMMLDNNLEKVNSKEFSESYKNAANKFSKYNIDNNVGTSNYKKETSSEPNNLKKMINETNTK